MSRSIKNPGLAALCAAHDLQIAELAGILRCHQTSFFKYATRRKPLPRIEAGLARIFELSIPELRKTLFSGGKHAKTARALANSGRSPIAAPRDPMAAFTHTIWTWDGETERWRAAGSSYARTPQVRELVSEGKLRARGAAIRIKKMPLGYFRAALFGI